ncbi:MAG TPA: anthranilate synthase component I family protein [Chitinophagaceae bacterium]|nr:anthranilate synthase component I family protein [Chitinophagaceae bacterium]
MNTNPKTNCLVPVTDFFQLKDKVLYWANRYGTFCFLDNQQYNIAPHQMECLVGVGIKYCIKANAGENALLQLSSFVNDAKESSSWLFGHLGYDLKNEIENLSSENPDETGFEDLFFFVPEVVIKLNEKELWIEAENATAIAAEIVSMATTPQDVSSTVTFDYRLTKDAYSQKVELLKQHILRGDCYEVNFCQEFFASTAIINPLYIFQKLAAISPNPFAALYKYDNKWLICASPERFLNKQENKIFSQPIKGTSKRDQKNVDHDIANKEWLRYSAKDRSENVMVVDLVRNDLSKICEEGSVGVEELFGIYSFPQVHQMISTISGTLIDGISFTDIIKACFPMGSMTGAPKKIVMELIEKYETRKRGIFSGALGYINPSGDFDFNVVIRSVMYNAASGYLSYQVGSGITHYCNAAAEWDECMMKAEAIRQVFQ